MLRDDGAHLPAAVPARLFHVTAAAGLPSILEHGLLTTTTLVNGTRLPDDEKAQLLHAPRRHSASIDHPELGRVWLRDQNRMTSTALLRVLDDGMGVADWCRLLNGMVFFFPSQKDALAMAAASGYKATPQVLLEVNTRTLVDAYATLVKIATFNTGSTSQGGAHARRGHNTFVPALRYPGTASRVREVVVAGDIRYLDHHLVRHRHLEPAPGQPPLVQQI